MDQLTKLEQKLGYTFNNQNLLKQALTHSSARMKNQTASDNERLEFLGDRVLGLSIAAALFERFPEALEGEMAKRFNGLVRMETCELVSRALDVGPFLIMSDSEKLTGGDEKSTILADACEAIVGAIYLDGGHDHARDTIMRLWEPYFENAVDVPLDPKSALQEWAQGKRLKLPVYKEIGRTGPDHAPFFVTEVLVGKLEPMRGEGNTKKVAQQNAAKKFLIREKVWEDDEA